MLTSPVSRTWRAVLGVIVGISAMAVLPGSAQAFSAAYAGYLSQSTPAHQWTYQGDRHTWVENGAYYPGTASFGICAAIKNYTTRVTVAGPYCLNSQVGRPAVTYLGGGYMDAGVGNQDDIARYVYGCAQTSTWDIWPC